MAVRLGPPPPRDSAPESLTSPGHPFGFWVIVPLRMSKPRLPDGVVAVVKRDCETCQMVVPVLRQWAAGGRLTVYTQDDPAFPGDPASHHDDDLTVSWHHAIETVPTLIKVVDGVDVARTAGWLRSDRRLRSSPDVAARRIKPLSSWNSRGGVRCRDGQSRITGYKAYTRTGRVSPASCRSIGSNSTGKLADAISWG